MPSPELGARAASATEHIRSCPHTACAPAGGLTATNKGIIGSVQMAYISEGSSQENSMAEGHEGGVPKESGRERPFWMGDS